MYEVVLISAYVPARAATIVVVLKIADIVPPRLFFVRLCQGRCLVAPKRDVSNGQLVSYSEVSGLVCLAEISY